MENRLQEFHHTLFPKQASGETVIVQIDARSLAEVQAWPWPRSLHGRAVDRLREAGARQIVFDVDFTTPAADPEQDRLFGGAIQRAQGRVTLPAVIENVDGKYGKRVEALPSPALRSGTRIGAFWVRLDDDLHVRRVPYSVDIAGARRPSLATVLADQASYRADNIPLDWSFNDTSFPTISYVDVLEGRFTADFFEGKNVLIGATASTLGDRFLAPLHGHIPGVFVQAVGSETLRRHQPVSLGPWHGLLATCLLVGASLWCSRPLYRLVALAFTTAAAAVLPLLLREYTPFIMESAPAFLAACAAMLLASAAALASALLSRVTLAPRTRLPNLAAMCLSAPAGAVTVAVRLRNHVETTALLGAEAQSEFLRKVYDRLSLAASGSLVFQVDDHTFAWRAGSEVQLETVLEAIEGLHALFAGGISIGDRVVDATITVGICDDLALDTQAAVAAAIVAADRAERRGLNYERYESDAGEDAGWRLSLLNELSRAIDNGDLWIAYQPKFDLKTQRITGAEALVRWTHPKRGEIQPDQFIPVMEENGGIEKLTLHVLRNAILDFSGLDENLSVAVNISARLIGHNRLVEPIRSLLSKYRMDARRLTLEITESAALAGLAGIEELRSLEELGAIISIDDYGTGQSTLSYLKMLPAKELKIDKSFVQLIATSKSDAAVVESTVKLAHALGMTVVAEGVESEEVLTRLDQIGCDSVQGFYIGEPVHLQEFERRISESGKHRLPRGHFDAHRPRARRTHTVPTPRAVRHRR